MLRHLAILTVFILFALCINAQPLPPQQEDSLSLQKLPSNYLDKVSSKASQLEQKLDKKTAQALQKMQKEEKRLKSKLAKIDSIAAENLFSGSEKKYIALQEKLRQHTDQLNQQSLGSYIPYMDTLKTALRFLETNSQKITGQAGQLGNKLTDAISKVNGLDAKMNQVQSIQQFLRERRQYLKEQLSNFGLAKHLKKMNKELFYFSQMVKDCRETLKSPKKIEAKALALLREVPAFKKFMQTNSQLASLFSIPTGNPGPVSFTGLQTRASVQQLMGSLPINNANPQQFITQQLQSANSQLSQQKNSIRFPELAENYGEMPDFKVNQQKGRPFLKRLEYSANVQFGKVNRFLPTSGEFAVSVGYKLNSNGVLGIGSSYKLGLGTGFNNIRFTHQGFGIRSYIDWRIKSGFYVSGGYEKNNLPQLGNISAPQRLDLWQESGLIGIHKKYPIGKKRKGSIQLLFDFLSYKNIPRSQPILLRTGIIF